MEHAYQPYKQSLKVSKEIAFIGIINRLNVNSLLVLQTLYNFLSLPHFNYCALAWGATITGGNCLHLSQQKKTLRLISKLNYMY